MANYLYQFPPQSQEASETRSTTTQQAAIGAPEHQAVKYSGQTYDFINPDDEHCFSLSTCTFLDPSDKYEINQYPPIGQSLPSTYTEFTDTSSDFSSWDFWEASSSKTHSGLSTDSKHSGRSFHQGPRRPKPLQDAPAVRGKRSKCVSCGTRRRTCKGQGSDCPKYEPLGPLIRTEEGVMNSESSTQIARRLPKIIKFDGHDSSATHTPSEVAPHEHQLVLSSMLPVPAKPSVSHAPSWDSSPFSIAATWHTLGSSSTLAPSFLSSNIATVSSPDMLNTAQMRTEEPFVVTTQHTAYRTSSTHTSNSTDASNAKDIGALFHSALLFRARSFINRATVEINSSLCSADRENGSASTSSSSPDGSNQGTGATTATSVTPAPNLNANGKRRFLDVGKENADENDDSGDDNNKRQKPLDTNFSSSLDQKFSCPFRKHSPTNYGLSRIRYATCATGSWKDISHVKEHIYRVHRAQCLGCKHRVKTQAQFALHQQEVGTLKVADGCNAYEGLLEHEILALKELKPKGLGMVASWKLLYATLFSTANSDSTPSPWYNPPCDSQCQIGSDKELRRRMPDEIAAFMESQFMALYNNISSKKPEILEFLMNRLRKRHSEMVPDNVLEATIQATPDQPHDAADLGNGEGPSAQPWTSTIPPDYQVKNTQSGLENLETLVPLPDTTTAPILGIDMPDLFQDFETSPIITQELIALHRKPDYQTGWFDGQRDGHAAGWNDGHEEGYKVGWDAGHEKGYLDGQREGYKAGKKAAEEGRMGAFCGSKG